MEPQRTVRILISYAYGDNIDYETEVNYAASRGIRLQLMADSGAFTAYTTGRTINLTSYAKWLNAWSRLFACAAPLDVIGDWRATADNVERLRDLVDNVNVLGAFHVNTPLTALERQCEHSTYVGVGGAIGLTSRHRAITRYLVDVHRIAQSANVGLHGFGMTIPMIVTSLPWLSVDSSYWNSAARTGTLKLYDTLRNRWIVIRVGNQKPISSDVARVIRSYGKDPTILRQPGFAMVRQRGDTGRDERIWMTNSTTLSWLRFAEAWRNRSTPVAKPPMVPEDGPSLYLAVSSIKDLRLIVDVAHGEIGIK